MDPVIVTSPAPARAPSTATGASRSRARWAHLYRPPLHLVVLSGVLMLSLALRLWGIKQGLPYSYNSDEASHFVPIAVGFLGGDLNPHYFLNPPAYTYLLYAVLVLWYGGGHGLHHAFVTDPTAVYVVARVVAAVLGTVAVWLTYLAGARLFGRWAGVLAAAVLGLAFLPVFYSHLALNDSPVLAPVALALVGVAGIVRRVRDSSTNFGAECPTGGHESPKFARQAVDYAVAGLGIGLAAATKYTGGFILLCLLVAAAFDARTDRRAAGQRVAIGLAVALAAFVIADPYAVLNHHAFLSGLSYQASAVGTSKLGASTSNGWLYYLWTFTWGLGWVPALAALAGGALLIARRRAIEAAVLLPAIVLYVVYIGAQERFFGRWLMPIIPLVAVLAAFAVAEALVWARRRLPAAALAAAAVGAAVLLLGQSVAADVHDDLVLSRPDTRNLARAWMVRHIPAGSRLVIEPVVPGNWGSRWRQYPTYLAQLPDGRTKPIHVDQYESYLFPGLLSSYVARGYCWVMTGSQQAARAYVNPAAARGAVAYYAALARRGRLVYRVSPYSSGARPPAFNYDWAFDYYPNQYRLPGPAISIYRLHGGRCDTARAAR
jgi:hypothetical protein